MHKVALLMNTILKKVTRSVLDFSTKFVKTWIPIILRLYITLKFAGCQKKTYSLAISNYRQNQVVFVQNKKNYMLVACSGD